MKKFLISILVLAALPALTQTRTTAGTRVNKTGIFPLNKSGGNLCTEFSGELTGNWFCADAPSSSLTAAPGMTISTNANGAFDSPFYRTGKDKGPATAVLFNGTTERVVTSNTTSPTGDVSCWAVVRLDGVPGYVPIITHAANGNYELQFFLNGSATLNVDLYKDNTTFSEAQQTTGVIRRGWHFVAFTYDFVTDGTSVLTAYLDGTAGTPVTTAVGPMKSESIPWRVMSREFGAQFAAGALIGAGCTEKALSAATIGKMSRAALGGRGLTALAVAVSDVPTYEVPVTTTRASAARFVVPSTSGDQVVAVGPGVPRITPNGAAIEQTRINLALQSEDFATTWAPSRVTVALPVVTANSTDVTDPLGGNTADKIVYPAVLNAGEQSTVFQTVTLTATNPYSAGVWLRTLSGTVPIWCYFYQGGSLFKTQISVNSTWQQCKTENNSVSSTGGWNIALGADNSGAPFTMTTTGGTIYAWGYQVEQGADLTGYVPTTTTAVTRAAESDVAAVSVAPKCVSGTWNTPSVLRAGAFLSRWAAMSTDCSAAATFDAYAPTTAPSTINCTWYTAGTSRGGQSASNFITASSSLRLRCQNTTTTNIATCLGTTCENTATTSFTPATMTSFYLGSYCQAGFEPGGTVQGYTYGANSGDCP